MQAYGVELALKNMEYKVLNDETPSAAAATAKDDSSAASSSSSSSASSSSSSSSSSDAATTTLLHGRRVAVAEWRLRHAAALREARAQQAATDKKTASVGKPPTDENDKSEFARMGYVCGAVTLSKI